MALTDVTPQLVSPAPSTIPSDFVFGGSPPLWRPSPTYDFLTNRVIADGKCMSGVNSELPQVAGVLCWTLQYFYSVADPGVTGDAAKMDSAGNPVGSLYERIEQDGPPTYVPPVTPAVVLKAVFGMYYGTPKFSDGLKRKAWSAFNGTTYQPGDTFFDGGPSASVENPTGVLPAADLYEVVQFGMGQVIVEIGTTAVLPVTG